MKALEALHIAIATRNWFCWRDVFEHAGAPTGNPLLVDPWRFKAFVREYGVARTISEGQSEAVRQQLGKSITSLGKALEDATGEGVDAYEPRLRGLAAREGNAMISLISKVAAFLAPADFSALDQYARTGVRRLNPRQPKFRNYSDYLRAVNAQLRPRDGELEALIKEAPVASAITNREAFKRRVLDAYLMDIGGRKYL